MSDKEELEGIKYELRHIAHIIEKIYKLAIKEEQEEFQLLIIWKGPNTMSTNSVTLNLTTPFGSNQAIPVELQNGQPFAFSPANIAWAVQDPTVATFVQNADGSTTWTPLKVGSTGVAVTDNSTGATAQGTLTVQQSTAGTFTMSIEWAVPSSGSTPAKATGAVHSSVASK